MKKCPFCAEDIQDAAIVCKHCKRELATQQKDAVPCPFCKALVAKDSRVCPACGDDISGVAGAPPRKAATSALKQPVSPVVGLIVLLVVAVVLYLMLNGSSSVSGPANSYLLTGSTSSGGVSLAQFQQLRDGMTYGEAVGVLGSPGTEQSRSNIGDIVTVMYSWPGSGTLGANMNAMFQNDKLVTKAQFACGKSVSGQGCAVSHEEMPILRGRDSRRGNRLQTLQTGTRDELHNRPPRQSH